MDFLRNFVKFHKMVFFIVAISDILLVVKDFIICYECEELWINI